MPERTPFEHDRRRRVTPRPPQQELTAAHDARHRIVHGPDDRPIVDKEQIRDPAQPLQASCSSDDDRFVAEIAAGGDDRETELPHQQMMQRRIGQHGAEPGIARRDRGGDAVRRSAAIGQSGRAGAASNASSAGLTRQLAATSASEGNITAKGFSSRRLRARRRRRPPRRARRPGDESRRFPSLRRSIRRAMPPPRSQRVVVLAKRCSR